MYFFWHIPASTPSPLPQQHHISSAYTSNNNTMVYSTAAPINNPPAYSQHSGITHQNLDQHMDDNISPLPTSMRPVSFQPREYPVSEPDLSKKPLRSALKGAKSKELFQRQLEQKLQERNSMSLTRQGSYPYPTEGGIDMGTWPGPGGDTPKAPPKVAPKPK